jgi:hypothetical protein
MHTIQFRPVGMSLGKWASYRLTPAIYVAPQPPREKTKNERSGSDSKNVDLCVVLNEAVVKTNTIMRVPTFYQYPSARTPSHMGLNLTFSRASKSCIRGGKTENRIGQWTTTIKYYSYHMIIRERVSQVEQTCFLGKQNKNKTKHLLNLHMLKANAHHAPLPSK